jgi:putative hemolysin
MTATVGIPVILLLVFLEGFFSGSEIALVSADKVAIRTERDRGSRSHAMLARFLDAPERILTTTLVGTNISVVTTTTVFALLLRQSFEHAGKPEPNVEGLTVLLLTPLVLVFGELIPKSLFRQNADRVAPLVIHPLSWLSWALFPVVSLVRGLTRTLVEMLGGDGDSNTAVSREELRVLLDQGRSETIEPREVRMIQRVFDFHEVIVKEVMRPLINVVAVEESETLEQAVAHFVESGYSRLPVFHERVDNIIGVLHAMDLMQADSMEGPVAALKRPVTYVPATQKVEALLEDLQGRRHGVAIVVDEYGGAEGMVTVEDILEEIVGEIEDEHDDPSPDILQRGERTWMVSARVEIDRLNEALSLELPEGDYETLGGFLLERLGRIPSEGEAVETPDATLTVHRANPRSIEAVMVECAAPTEEEDLAGQSH